MLDKVIVIAKQAGDILMNYYNNGKFDVELKNNQAFNFVTSADKASDVFLRKAFKKAFPGDQVITEEHKSEVKDFRKRVWFVDPLDSTKSFVNHMNSFSVMIGACDNGIPTMGVVYAPALKLLYYAEKDKGAFMEQESKQGETKTIKLKVTTTAHIKDATIVTRISLNEPRKLDSAIAAIGFGKVIPESSVGLKLGLIAQGKADCHINSNINVRFWDTCAPEAILSEAGGIVTDFNGKPLNYKDPKNAGKYLYIASNGVLHPELVKACKGMIEKYGG